MGAKNILLTGKPGSGKTTIIKEALLKLNINAGGFYTSEIRRGEKRVGFKIETLDGKRGILSHIDIASPKRLGKYGIDVESLENLGVKAIEDALAHKEIIIIDEIGHMELSSLNFKKVLFEALNSDKVVLGTIMKGSTPLVDEIKMRSDVELLEVSRETKDSVTEQIVKIIDELRSQFKL
ncbi:MAG: NTPase [Fidelibacterota bacterium]